MKEGDFSDFFEQKAEEGDSHDYTRYNFENKDEERRERQRQAKEAAKEEAKKRSVKEIYRDLIKVFHPDKEQDEEKKAEKEEISKELTEAYRNDDLLALLKYELKLLTSSQDRVKDLANSKLKIYNEVLKDQKLALEAELYMLKQQNEFVYRNMCTKNANKAKFLKKIVQEYRQRNESLQQEIEMLKSDNFYWMDFVEQYLYRGGQW